MEPFGTAKDMFFQTKAAFKAIRCRYPSQKAQHKYKKKVHVLLFFVDCDITWIHYGLFQVIFEC